MNWIVGNLQNALDTWNGKLSEIYSLVTQSPADFKGGAIWDIITNINGTYINSSDLLLREIRFCRRNDTMNISIKRPDGKEYKNYTINIILK